MKKILLTGSSGFLGKNILPILNEIYQVYAPKRAELDLLDGEQVRKYLQKEKFDVVVHFASPSPARSNNADTFETLFEDSLRIFMNFYTARNLFGKMIYSGSGAEYDKRQDIKMISENNIGKHIPVDNYGLSKYIINELAKNSNNIYNLRIFACYGPYEYDYKFITHAIQNSLNHEPITIKQNCYFDYLYVEDYARFVMYFIENDPKFHDYNATSGTRVKLSEIAELVRKKLSNPHPITILSEGMNCEYTANNQRIIKETGITDLISLDEGISKMIEWRTRNG